MTVPTRDHHFIIGIDPATACGWAVLDEKGNRRASGVWDLSVRPGEGAGFRFVRYVGYLRQCFAAYGPLRDALLFYEAPAVHRVTMSRGADLVSGGLIAHTTYQCEAKGIPYKDLAIATIKKHATGTGIASKRMMVAAANERWGLELRMSSRPNPKKEGDQLWSFPGGGDNEADALWIADTGRMLYYS